MTVATTCAYLRLRVGQEWYGVPVAHVVEVLHLVALNEPPSTNILGLLTLRDMLVPVVDMRVLFGVQPRLLHLDTPIVTVRQQEQAVGWVVDEADDVVIIPSADHIPYSAPYIRQAAYVDDMLLFLIELDDLMQAVQPST